MRYSIHFKNLNFPEVHIFVDSIESLVDRNKSMENLAVKQGESKKLCEVRTISGDGFNTDFTTKAVRDAITNCYTQQRDQVLEYGLGFQDLDGTNTPLEDLGLPVVGSPEAEAMAEALKKT